MAEIRTSRERLNGVRMERHSLWPVALVPFRDPWLATHETRIGRFLRKEDAERVLGGPPLPVVLIAGVAAGRWTLSPVEGGVEIEWFQEPSPAVRVRARELRTELGAFARRYLANLRPLSISTAAGEFPVYR